MDAQLRTALAVVPPERDVVPVSAAAALNDPRGALDSALGQYAGGMISRATFRKGTLFATQVAADETERPWANDLRRSVADRTALNARRGEALYEFSDWLHAHPKATFAEAREASAIFVAQRVTADREDMRARIPMPSFALVARHEMTPATIETARKETISAAERGELSLEDLSREASVLSDWREALGTSV
jgi:hypothetical protein